MDHWRKITDEVAPEKRLALIAEAYLSALHRDNPGHGCSIPALGAEIARESPKTRKAFAGKLDEMIEMMTDFIPNLPRKAARKQAIATLTTMAGTMLLARIAGSSELSDEVLKTGRDSALDGARREPKAAAAKKAKQS
jgi:TetR/AcrR family transcriptional repressor of nem operon